MSKINKLSHVSWHCQYHIMWVRNIVTEYLKIRSGSRLRTSIRVHAERLGCIVVGLNVQPDHVHLISAAESIARKATGTTNPVIKVNPGDNVSASIRHNASHWHPFRVKSKPRSKNVNF